MLLIYLLMHRMWSLLCKLTSVCSFYKVRLIITSSRSVHNCCLLNTNHLCTYLTVCTWVSSCVHGSVVLAGGRLMFDCMNGSPTNVLTKHNGCTVKAPIYSESLPPLIVGFTFLTEGKSRSRKSHVWGNSLSGAAALIIRWHWLTPKVRSHSRLSYTQVSHWCGVSLHFTVRGW